MQNQAYSGSIKLRDMQISFEGPQEFVEEMVARFASPNEWHAKETREVRPRLLNASPTEASRRDLVLQKQPRGHHEIIAVLGFFLTESGTEIFGEADVRRAYIEAGIRPPKVVAQALRDAKNKYGYIVSAGKRGRYRLSGHGDNLVRFDLPRVGGN
jgi:hypothetical protein